MNWRKRQFGHARPKKAMLYPSLLLGLPVTLKLKRLPLRVSRKNPGLYTQQYAHDRLNPVQKQLLKEAKQQYFCWLLLQGFWQLHFIDRKSTRLNSSHVRISYAVFCLKKKKRKSTKVL